MPKINRTAILSVDAIRAFEVVNRVEGYPDFLPGCEKVKILESTEKYSTIIKPQFMYLKTSPNAFNREIPDEANVNNFYLDYFDLF